VDFLIFSGQILMILALGPGSLWFIYRRDKQNHPLIKDLLVAYGLGMLVNIFFINIYLNLDYFSYINYYQYDSKPILFFKAVFIFGFMEELARFSVLWYYIRPVKKFNSPLDGVFYAFAICLGFAATQNIILLMDSSMIAGSFWRNSFFDFLFSLIFASIWGYAVGIYKFERKIRPVIWTFIFCFLMHGFIDFCLIININFFWIFIILLPLMVFTFHKLRFFESENLNNEVGN
jgi:RsiW-degrading membrane proteinase PrsW (M82 family)